jgi:hypothetical protein
MNHVFTRHGFPVTTISDRGPQFNSMFLKNLYSLLGIEPHFSTAYHPQSDGQTECVNQNLEQYLRLYINKRQSNWVDLLPLAEFAYNNATHESTGMTPFYANYGYHPAMNGAPIQGIKGASKELADHILKTQEELHSMLKLAQEKQKEFYDNYVNDEEFQEGDKVWLKHENFTTTRPSQKLDYKWMGPYTIEKRYSRLAYQLKLPTEMKMHPVFNIDKLSKWKPDQIPGRPPAQPPPVVVEPTGPEWEVCHSHGSD